MAEPNPAPNNNPTPDPNNPDPNPAPAPDPNNPTPPNPDPNPAPVQLTKEQLAAAFEHPRFKELSTAAQELKDLKAKQAKEDEDRAKANGEHEKLADKYKADAEAANNALNTERANNRIMLEAVKAGITDPDAALKLIDRGNIKVNDDGSVEGVEDAVKALAESKPYLKGAPGAPTNLGGPTNPDPNGGNNPPAFTGSQVKDHAFYKEHEKEIDKAVGEGRVDWSK